MQNDLIKAHLNLHAVLQNLEDLLRLDEEMADLAKDWNITIQFSVRNGPAAYVSFKNGVCEHGCGKHPKPTVKLFFTSAAHINAMFDGKGIPIPLKGFSKLGFMQKDFAKLTDKLEYYLKPENVQNPDEKYERTSATLTLLTGAFAVKELALLDPVSQKIAATIPDGKLLLEVLPDGPYLNLTFSNSNVSVGKGTIEKPMAKMTFSSMQAANDVITGKLDPFQAIASSQMVLYGQIPMIDNMNLILDRVESFLN